MSGDVVFRQQPRPADREAVRRIVAATGFFNVPEVDVAVELIDERLAKGPESGYEFVFADEGDETVGYACYGPIAATSGSFDLYWIAVDPKRQGRGLGNRILREAERLIAAGGGRRVYIETSDRPQYAPTRGFYERAGYLREATLVDFYAPGDDKVIYGRAVG